MRALILSPLFFDTLKSFVQDGESLPEGMGGYNVANYVCERIRKGLITDVVTLILEQDEPIKRWEGELLRIWTVRRRTQGMCRDFYSQEVSLLVKAITESNADVVHVNWTYEYALAAVRAKRPFLLTVHDHAGRIWKRYPVRYAVNFFISMYVLRNAACVCAVAPNVSSFVSKVVGYNVPWIANGFRREWIDLSDKVCHPMQMEAPVISSALNWSRIKNVKNALRAFKEVKSYTPSAIYRLMGPGLGKGEAAQQWAERHGLADGVEFRGKVPYQQCLNEIKKSTMYFHPSIEESFGCSVAEALLFRVPVVACKEAKGSSWLLADGKFGKLASGNSPEEMSKAILSLLDLSPGLNELEERRKHILSICDPDHIVDQYQELYSKDMCKGSI